MATRYVVVDGSNIATEGRSIPSLAQLDEAVRAFMAERPSEQVIVVVDASFSYRIDQSERAEFDQAEEAGEIVSPPAGALGRGDGFLLRIADRTDAVVLSNDSFQEFHGEYPWLFESGRLIGGKPVPGVGWIFTLRTPVRGPRSRESMRAADKAKRAASKRAPVAEGPVAEAIAEATAEAIDPDDVDEDVDAGGAEPAKTAAAARRGRRRRAKPMGSVNDPLPFIEFIAEHPLGSEVQGEVEAFTSHGAFVNVGSARCYVPLVALADPPPRSAKEVLTRGEERTFVLQALDPPRRGIELALPGLVRVAGVPTEETVEADIGAGRRRGARPRRDEEAAAPVEAPSETAEDEAAVPVPAKRSRKKKAAAVAAPEAAVATPEGRAETGAEVAAPARSARGRKKAAEPALAADEFAQAAPARRSRRRAASEPMPAADEPVAPKPAAPEPAADAAAPEEASAGRTRTRRSRRSAKGEEAASAEAQPADTAVAPAEPEAAPSPRRRGRRAAAPAPTDAPPADAPPPDEPAPARSRRKAAAPAPAPTPAEAQPAPAPAPAARKRRTPAESAPPVDEPVERAAATGPRRSPARNASKTAAPRTLPVDDTPSEQPPVVRRRTRKAASTEPSRPPAAKKAKKTAASRTAKARSGTSDTT